VTGLLFHAWYSLLFSRILLHMEAHESTAVQPGEAAAGAEHRPVPVLSMW
jgi:hypothetical protein